MGRRVRASWAVLRTAGLILAAAGCGAELVAVAFIPAFAFQFVDEKDPSHVFFFDPGDDAGKTSGNLTGTEDRNGASAPLNGTFKGQNLTFRVARAGGVLVDFAGHFLDADRIELTSSGGTIIVCRTDTSSPPFKPCNQKTT